MRLGIFGKGKLGQAVARILETQRNGMSAGASPIELAWIIDRGESPTGPVDIALDASAAEAVAGHVAWAIENRVDLAIGATGWDPAILDAARSAGDSLPIGILVSPNFSLGVAFLRRIALALGGLATLDPGCDLSALERHHRAKADAPSGTAKLLASALVEGAAPRFAGWEASPASPSMIPVASLREGREVGFHELRLEAEDEVILVSHEARDRGLFARGALASMAWLHGRKGVHSFDDFAAETLDPLFATGLGRERRDQS